MRRVRVAMLSAGLAFAVSGCASGPPLRPTIAPPIDVVDRNAGYRFGALRPGPGNSDEFTVVVAISGGGARAAALGFGALEALAEIEMTRSDGAQTTLLDEVDIIAGVSGGSYVAAAFALDGPDMLTTFPERFLYFDFTGALWGRTLSPSGLVSTFSPIRGRTEVLQRLLDDRLFRGATFGDLVRRGTRPYLAVSATSMATAARFEFSQDQFDALCSDLSAVRLSFAAASSSAFPILFSPTTLVNHADQCGYQSRTGSGASEGDPLADGARFPYVHLFDGGLSDNLGLRGLLDLANADEGGDDLTTTRDDLPTPREVIIVLVDAQNHPAGDLAKWPLTPNVLQTARAVGEVTVRRYNTETIRMLRENLSLWEEAVEVAVQQGELAHRIHFRLVEVNLEQIADPEKRAALQGKPTTLRLSRDLVDALRAEARRQISAAPSLQGLSDEGGVREDTAR